MTRAKGIWMRDLLLAVGPFLGQLEPNFSNEERGNSWLEMEVHSRTQRPDRAESRRKTE